MFRRFKTIVAAAVVALIGTGASQAAPIGTFSIVDPFGTGSLFTIDVSNLSDSASLFSGVSVLFCDGSVVPADPGVPGFSAADGSVRTCLGTLTPSSAGAFGDGSVMPGDGKQLIDPEPSFELPASGFAFLSMAVTNAEGRSVPFFVDALDLSCEPVADGDCTNFIYSTAVPEPVSLLLLTAGLGALAAGRRRRRSGS